MYQYQSRIRFSEVDRNRKLSIVGLINYLQDCSTFQSEDTGFSVERLLEEKQGWFILSWQIEIDSLPSLGEEIVVSTSPSSYKGLFANRDFTMAYPGGEPFVRVRSIWVLMDLEKGTPLRAPQEMRDAYGMEEPLEGNWGGRKIKLPEESLLVDAGSFQVPRSYLDTNNHMNNSHYIEEALAVLPTGSHITGIRTEYRKQAVLKDMVYISAAATDHDTTVLMKDEAGEILAVIRLLTQSEKS